MQKAVVIKQTWAIILMAPHYQLEAFRCACVYIAARRLGYCTQLQEAVLSQRAAKCGLHNSVKLSQCSPNWTLVCFVTSWGSGLDSNRTFFVKYAL